MFYHLKIKKRFGAMFTVFLLLATDARADEKVLECELSFFRERPKHIYRIDDGLFGLMKSFEILEGSTFVPACENGQLRNLLDNGADVWNDNVFKWAKNFNLQFTDTGAICEFDVRIQLNYWATIKFKVELDTIRLERSWTSNPFEFEDGTPNGEKILYNRGSGRCEAKS